MAIKIKSPVFDNGQFIPSRHTCDGENINPALEFLKIPKEAKSLVLIADSPEVPSRDWIHWLVWNIDPKIKKIASGKIPAGAREALNDFRMPGYRGPCPPWGVAHQYHFKIFALDAKLKLAHDATCEEVKRAMRPHIIEHAILSGLYKKK